MANGFTFNDGWMLCTLWGCNGPVEIGKLQCVADMFNHSCFHPEEIEATIRNLAAAGLAHPTDGVTYQITDDGNAFVESHWVREKGHIVNMFDVARALKTSSLYVPPYPNTFNGTDSHDGA